MVSCKNQGMWHRHTGLDGIYRCVGEWTHGTGYKADNHMLVGRKVGQLWLLIMGNFLQFLIRGEVRAWVVVSLYQFGVRITAYPDWLLAEEQ